MDIVKIEDLNDIMRGYLIRACREANYSHEQMSNIFGWFYRALDDMTEEEAMREWSKYCNGQIKFIKKEE